MAVRAPNVTSQWALKEPSYPESQWCREKEASYKDRTERATEQSSQLCLRVKSSEARDLILSRIKSQPGQMFVPHHIQRSTDVAICCLCPFLDLPQGHCSRGKTKSHFRDQSIPDLSFKNTCPDKVCLSMAQKQFSAALYQQNQQGRGGSPGSSGPRYQA